MNEKSQLMNALKEMAEKKPKNLDDMREIFGIGDVKLKKYGQRFLDGILYFLKEYRDK